MISYPLYISVSRHKQSGFSLIETAIVLGVVGLVIGGIWIAAATVSREHSANEAFTDISASIGRLDNYPMWQLAGYQASSLTEIMPNLLALGVLDSTYQCNTTFCSTTKHPYMLNFSALWAWGSRYYTATITAPSQAACTALLIRMANLVKQRGPGADTATANCIYNQGFRYAPNLNGSQICIGVAAPLETFEEAITVGCGTTKSFVVNIVR